MNCGAGHGSEDAWVCSVVQRLSFGSALVPGVHPAQREGNCAEASPFSAAHSLVLANLPRQQPDSLEKPSLKSPVKREHRPANLAGAPGQDGRRGGEEQGRRRQWRDGEGRSWGGVKGLSYGLKHQLVDCSHSNQGRSWRICPPVRMHPLCHSQT